MGPLWGPDNEVKNLGKKVKKEEKEKKRKIQKRGRKKRKLNNY